MRGRLGVSECAEEPVSEQELRDKALTLISLRVHGPRQAFPK